MLDPLGNVLTVLLLMVAGLFIWLALSPFEMLGWWAGWFGDTIYWDSPPEEEVTEGEARSSYIVFFSGVGRATGETLSYRERDFLRRLAEALPDARVIDDIFPYAVNNQSLTRHPFLARLWRVALRSKAGGIPLAGYLINLRNIMQMLISADRRYGPLFNQGVAEVIVNGLLRHGYTLESDAPIFLIGYSGAGQMAVGSALYLKRWLRSPVFVISLGGVFGSDPALLAVDQLYHLVGSKDTVEPWWVLAPGRWPLFATSEWNRAVRQGRVTRVEMGPMVHTGAGGYLDAKTRLPDGTLYVDATVEKMCHIVEGELARVAVAEAASQDAPPGLDDVEPPLGPPDDVLGARAEAATQRPLPNAKSTKDAKGARNSNDKREYAETAETAD